MTERFKLANVAFDSIEAQVFQRTSDAQIEIRTGVESISVGRLEIEPAVDLAVYAVEFRHFVTSKSKGDNLPFYTLSIVAKSFVRTSKEFTANNDEVAELIHEALRFAMPVTGLRLRTLSYEMGIQPTPTIAVAPNAVAKPSQLGEKQHSRKQPPPRTKK